MPAVLTHKSIMLLARERLRLISELLKHKVESGAPVSDLEHRVRFLADKAYTLMSENAGAQPAIQHPAGEVYVRPLGGGVSRFAVMGSMGPDIPGFSALFSPGQEWAFDTIHKGNPDANRERVVARTHTFVLELWSQVRRAVTENRATEAEAQRLAAYALGHLCHVAADVVSHPYINDLEWHVANSTRKKFSHAGGEGSIDAMVARQVLLRESTREGQDWEVWWPTFDEVPSAFFDAYVAALESVYAAEHPHSPNAFGAFKEKFAAENPPALDAAFVRDGYRMYRHGVMTMGYSWGYWDWFGFLTPLVVPLMSIFPLLYAMPAGKQFVELPIGEVSERGWMEMLMLPAVLGSFPAIFYGLWMNAITTHGVEGRSITGIVLGFLAFTLGIVFFATLGQDTAWWLRWLILFAPVALSGLIFSTMSVVDFATGRTGRGALSLIFSIPVLFSVVTLLLTLLFLGAAQGKSWGNIVAIILLSVVGLLLWFLLPLKLREVRIPESPEPFPADRPHLVRLFDDSTLWAQPDVAQPSLSDLHYPSQRRPLLKLWWTGAGDLYARSEQSRIQFNTADSGPPTKTVLGPVVPMTARDFIHQLEAEVPGLHAALVYADDGDREPVLLPGATFSEEFDFGEHYEPKGDADAHGVPAVVAGWRKLSTSEDEVDYVLFHADKPYQSIRYGKQGPVASANPEEEGVSGPGEVKSGDGLTVTGEDTAFGWFFEAGDLIQVEGQTRTVTAITSDTELTINAAFNPAIDSFEPYLRMGSREEASQGYTYVSNPGGPGGPVGGETLMDYAADLGALLCLGLTPHLMKDTERRVRDLEGKHPAGGGDPINPKVPKVYQVFRNWNLDRRRLNEWRMILTGGAHSEKSAPGEYDSALPHPRDTDWSAGAPGEDTANDMGWVPVLREWLARAAQRSSVIDPVAPVNGPASRELSRALAFLLDLPDPVIVA
ncbi:zinc dependent phospholipase C family protein [Hyalangium sp.]|uniref:zinc dependent phospholipase C family protein n=1 Tax=Hyalangium sp. TaxID=2028555 RepID=UPI002D592A03|nr:zinc dependent phospholipase C family protein [Hyalangium sp.]HYI00864.1 zinc dependent phospholipase C family protein [Hyalangium sp.]